MTPLDGFAGLSALPINLHLNGLIERAEPRSKNTRRYLGASSVGSDCLRKTQYDWKCTAEFPVRINDIFSRGFHFENLTRQRLIAIGFEFAPVEQLEFKALDGQFCGHADGVAIRGPELPNFRYPAIWENKCLGAKGWSAIERDGLTGLYKVYAVQVALYQQHLDLKNPALFTVTNADSCERLHFNVPFNAQLAQIYSERAAQVITTTNAGKLLPRIATDPDDWHCRSCGHQRRCWRTVTDKLIESKEAPHQSKT